MKFDNTTLFEFQKSMGVPMNVALRALSASRDLEDAKAWVLRNSPPRGPSDGERLRTLERRLTEIEETAKHLQEQSTALIRQARNLSEAVERITGILERLVPDDK